MIITIAGGKGGTGKSMVASSLAYEYAKCKKTILIDADVDCPNAHLLLNISRKKIKSIFLPIPRFEKDACIGCGKCARICKQNAIAFVPGKVPAFVKELCIGCNACFAVCPMNAIHEDQKEIGTIYGGENFNVQLVSGELKLGEHASGDVVTVVRRYAEETQPIHKSDIMIIDAAAGIGCPVIASFAGSDYLVAVTEPTPSALHDLQRMVYLADHFRIPHGIVINKYDLEEQFCEKIIQFGKEADIPIIGKIPYRKEFIDASLHMCPVAEFFPEYNSIFKELSESILEQGR